MRGTYSIGKRLMAMLLCVAMVAAYLPGMAWDAHAAVTADGTRVADTSTANSYTEMLGTDNDGNRYSGRIWSDKSVFTDSSVNLGDTGISAVENDSDFMVVYSALGSTTSVSSTTVVGGSLDVVVVLDNSMSMSNAAGSTGDGRPNSGTGTTRLEAVTDAANELINNILENESSRLSVVTYSTGAHTLLPLDYYNKGTSDVLSVNSYSSGNNGGKMTATAVSATTNRTVSNTNSGYKAGTNLQAGIDMAMDNLLSASNTSNRAPVIIVLTDGVADTAVQTGWYEVETDANSTDADTVHPAANTITAGVALSSLLNAAYKVSLVEDKYGANPTVYGVGVDLGTTSDAFVVMNPKTAFNSEFSSLSKTAYSWYEQWLAGTDYTQSETVSRSNYNWDYSLPSGLSQEQQNALKADVDANIQFVDTYYNVSAAGAELGETFDEIVQSMNQSVFHPITDTVVIGGETANTPLTYVDFIGDYMEVKDIKAVTLFGKQYSVTAGTPATTEEDNGDGTYTVTKTTPFLVGSDTDMITHPVMNVTTAVGDSVTMELIETYTVRQTDNALIKSTASDQQLWIYINKNALPLIYDEVVEEASGKVTYTRTAAEPVRVYYTVGLTDDIKAEDGTVMTSRISAEYLAANTAEDGTVYFYANQYGQMNGSTVVDDEGNIVSQSADGENYFYRTGDAHTSAAPSQDNRYYYHLANQSIFTHITDTQSADGSISWESNEFGIEWEENRYELTRLTYSTYQQYMADLANGTDHQVYTYVSFYRPLENTAGDGSNGEKVTYLVYTQWSLLCNDIAFYDQANGVYINYDAETNTISTDSSGIYIDVEAMPAGVSVASVISAYISNVTAYAGTDAKAVTAADIYAVLGIGSLRTPRLSNMAREKLANETATAHYSYVPTRDADDDTDHVGDLVVWLGNNGRLAVDPSQGLSLTKVVSDFSEETNAPTAFNFEITIASDEDFDGTRISVMDAYGSLIDTSVWSVGAVSQSGGTYSCTVSVTLADGETVYIVNLPAGAAYAVQETGAQDYYEVSFVNGTGTVENNVITSVTATNDAIDYADLYITKEIVHGQEGQKVPESVLAEEFTVAVNFGTALAGRSFSMEHTGSAAAQIVVDTDGVNELTIRHGETIAIRDIPAGTEITVTEIGQDGHFTAAYRSRNHSGMDADEDGNVTITVDGNNSTHDAATVVITNTYTPSKVSVDLDITGTKDLDITSAQTDEAHTFEFQVQQYDEAAGKWTDMLDAPVAVVYDKGAAGEKPFVIENVLQGIEYSTVGTYTYQVVEVIPETKADGITYDRTLYTFTVVVEDAGGALKATVYDLNADEIDDLNYEVTFVNTYHTAPVIVDAKKTVVDKSGSYSASAQNFLIAAFPAILDSEGKPTTDSENNWLYSDTAAVSMHTDGAGEARYTMAYDKAGSYYYVVKEVDQGKSGWEYDGTVYEIQIEVTEAADGSLRANLIVDGQSQNTNTATLAFENTYDPKDTSMIPTVNKTITGRELTDEDDFTFYIYKDGDRNTVMSTGSLETKNGKTSAVKFDKELEFASVGTYYFDILEKNGGSVIDGVTYDPTVYDMVVEVVDNGGILEASYYFEDEVGQSITFTNVYNVTGTATLDLSGTKDLSGRTLAEGEFNFHLIGMDGDKQVRDITTANHSNGAIIFPTITYTAEHVGHTYTYTVSEDNDGLGGIEYDENTYQFTVEVLDNGEGGIALKIDGQIANENKVQLDGFDFRNTYTAEKTSVTLTGTKTLLGDRPLSDREFYFDVYEGTDVVASGTNVGSSIVFDKIEYDMDDVGTHIYEVVERSGSLKGISYDDSSYTVTVRVVDDGKGQIHAYVTYTDGDLNFTNSYNRQNAEVEITGMKNLTGRDLEDGEFEFAIYRADEDFNKIGDALRVVRNDAEGRFSFGNGVFSQPGTYYYVITETDGGLGGIQYDSNEYHVTILVEDNVNYDGKMSTSLTIQVDDEDKDEIVFNNIYSAESAHLDLKAIKEYEKGFAQDVFTFILTGHGQNQKKTNDIYGDVVFDTIYLDKTGSYTFTITEENSGLAWVSYDETVYQVTLEVKDDGEGQLYVDPESVIYTADNKTAAEIVFDNDYLLTPNTVTIGGDKVLTENGIQKTLTGGEFTFELYEGDTQLQTTTNIAGGSFAFEAIEYMQAGEHTYTVKEIIPADREEGMIYDETVYTVKVSVTDDNKGNLIVDKQLVGAENILFTNTLHDIIVKDVAASDDPEIKIDGQKVEDNDILIYTITYTNTTGEDVTATITDVLPKYTEFISASDNGICKDGTVTWTLEVKKNTTEEVSVTVRVAAPQQILVNDATVYDGTNTYTSNEVYNHTAEEVLVKDVKNAYGISIDGEKVTPGEELTYIIDYFNATAEEVTVTITDKIPAHTTFKGVDEFGSYNGTDTVKWTLTLKPWSTETVSFVVTVDEPDVFIDNTATALVGTNEVVSNTVTNHTFEEVGGKDVTLAGGSSGSIDGKAVTVGDVLEYTISYTNITEAPVDVTITDEIPAYTKVLSIKDGVEKDGVITWTVKDVQPRQEITVSFQVTVVGTGVVIENQAQIFDGTNKLTNTVTNSVPKKSVDKQTASTGEVLTYTIEYINTTGDVADVVITDKLDAALTYVDGTAGTGVYADGTITWKFKDVPAGQRVTVSFQAKIKADADKTGISNVAQVIENEAKIIATNETVVQAEKPALSILKEQAVGNGTATTKQQSVKAGDEVTYTITVTNSGKGNAYGITVSDKLPEGLSYVAGSANEGGKVENGTVFWNLDTLASGQSVKLTFKVTVPKVDKDTAWTNVAAVVYENNPNGDKPVESDGVQIDLKVPATYQTGDGFSVTLFISLMVLSSFGLAAVIVCKKREEDSQTQQ